MSEETRQKSEIAKRTDVIDEVEREFGTVGYLISRLGKDIVKTILLIDDERTPGFTIVGEKIGFVFELLFYLEGSYDDVGLKRWFRRKRAQLNGKSALELLAPDWSPGDSTSQEVIIVARALID